MPPIINRASIERQLDAGELYIALTGHRDYWRLQRIGPTRLNRANTNDFKIACKAKYLSVVLTPATLPNILHVSELPAHYRVKA